MHTFPRDLIRTATTLPGVPNTTQVAMFLQHHKQSKGPNLSDFLLNIDHSLFNLTRYDELRDRLVDHALHHMTWTAVADYLWTTFVADCLFTTVQSTYPMCFSCRRMVTRIVQLLRTMRRRTRPGSLVRLVCHHTPLLIHELHGMGRHVRPNNDKCDTGHTMASLFGPNIQLFTDQHARSKQRDYGRGFSYTNVFDNWSSAQGAATRD
jgi:hypothetical protein